MLHARKALADRLHLIDELFRLEEATQVEHLPCGQTEEAAHGEEAEVEDLRVGGFCNEILGMCSCANAKLRIQ